ncbi:DUF2225 domain-containing protein [Chryseosolibacter histidini]|nr:DUF2225 domain-containing protein [Chryseosolibacter histidini]
MKFVVVTLFVALSIGARAQVSPSTRHQVDSLKLRLKEKTSDYLKATTLGSLAGHYIDIDADSSALLIEDAAALCPLPEHDTALVRVYLNYAKALHAKRKKDQRYAYLLKAKSAMKTLSPPSKYRRAVYSELGDHYYSLQHGDSCLYYDLAVLDNSVDSLDMIIALKRVGVTYNNIGNTVKALESYLRALRLLDKFDNPAQKAGILNNAGVLYEDDGDNVRAEQYYKEALTIFREMKNARQITMVLTNLGIVYDHDNRPKEALACFAEAENLRKENNLLPSNPLHLNIGNSLMHSGRATEALERFRTAMEGFKRNDDNYGISLGYRHMGEALYDLGRYQEAEKTELLALTRARQQGDAEIIQQATFDLARIYGKTGQYKKAFEYQGNYLQMQDSLRGRDRRIKLGLLEKEYELAHKEDENNALARENEIRKIQSSAERTTRIALGTSLVFFVLLAAVTASGYYRTKAKNTQLSQQKSKIEQANLLITQQAQQLKDAADMKSRFFANVSHELRTPVTLVNGMLEMMQQGSPEGKSRDHLDIAVANSRRLQTLVNEVLDLAKPGTDQAVINKKQVTLLPLLNRIIYSFESLLVKKNIRLEVQVSALKDLQLPLDEDKFEKIINNLIYNAIKFNHEGGWIKVEGRFSASTERVIIEVSDSGIGIPESEQPYVFDRFYQSSATETKNGQGLGIGLSLVKELTLLHGGDVAVRSQLNEGSVFTVSLPTTQEAVSLQEKEDEDISAEAIQLFPGNYEKMPAILLVEDNAEMRYYLKEILGNAVTIHETVNGREALQWLKTNTPDLILSDVMMPEMDGYEFLHQLKSDAHLRGIPVVMLTARASEEDLLHGLRLGVDDYIVKPFNALELKIRIHNLLTNQLIRKQWQEKPVEPGELPPSPSTNDIFIKKVEQLVESRAADASLGVPDLAEHLALSERQLYRTTGSLTGMTPAQLIKEIRLKIAFKLLMNKKVTKVSALAAQVGFDNSAYFSQQFLARFGKKPVEFL